MPECALSHTLTQSQTFRKPLKDKHTRAQFVINTYISVSGPEDEGKPQTHIPATQTNEDERAREMAVINRDG